MTPAKRRTVPVKLPTGSLIRFVGNTWLDSVTGKIALVTGHVDPTLGIHHLCCLLETGRSLAIPYEMVDIDEELEVIS